MKSESDLPPNYESLNEEELKQANVIEQRARQKDAENWQRDQALAEFEERYLRRQVDQ